MKKIVLFFKKNVYKRLAFTLAEVLITLGIIGIVAEMTIPSIYSNYQKQLVSARVQKFYSMMYQAIRRSEIDNGPVSTWSFGTDATWFDKYLAPYIRYLKETSDGTAGINVWIDLPDGTFASFKNGGFIDAFVYWGEEYPWTSKNIYGKTSFGFRIAKTATNNVFAAYDWAFTPTDRNSWLTQCQSNRLYCTGLIMWDHWEIKSDYPYFN